MKFDKVKERMYFVWRKQNELIVTKKTSKIITCILFFHGYDDEKPYVVFQRKFNEDDWENKTHWSEAEEFYTIPNNRMKKLITFMFKYRVGI
jgi:hypothetical protein